MSGAAFLEAFRRLDVAAMLAALAPDAVLEVPGVARWEGHDAIAYFLTRWSTALPDATVEVEGSGPRASFRVAGTAVDGARFATRGTLTVEEAGGRVTHVTLAAEPEKVTELLERLESFATRLGYPND